MAKSNAKNGQTTAENLIKDRENVPQVELNAAEVKASQADNAEGKVTGGKKYKLADENTSYSDPESREFTLAGKQEKELPEYPSVDLFERIKSGFIVEA